MLILYEYCPNGCWAVAVIGQGGRFIRKYVCSQCSAKLIFERIP